MPDPVRDPYGLRTRLRTSMRHRIRMAGCRGEAPPAATSANLLRYGIRARSRTESVPDPVRDPYGLRTRLRTSMRHRIRMAGCRGEGPPGCYISLPLEVRNPCQIPYGIRARSRPESVPDPVRDPYGLRTRPRTSMRHRIRVWGVVGGKHPRLPRQPGPRTSDSRRNPGSRICLGCHLVLHGVWIKPPHHNTVDTRRVGKNACFYGGMLSDEDVLRPRLRAATGRGRACFPACA